MLEREFLSIEELERHISELQERFGALKVNLVHRTGDHEGIWAVPMDATSSETVSNDQSRESYALVYLLNQPLGWAERTWGAPVRVKTQGELRPIARIDDQIDLEPMVVATAKLIQKK